MWRRPRASEIDYQDEEDLDLDLSSHNITYDPSQVHHQHYFHTMAHGGHSHYDGNDAAVAGDGDNNDDGNAGGGGGAAAAAAGGAYNRNGGNGIGGIDRQMKPLKSFSTYDSNHNSSFNSSHDVSGAGYGKSSSSSEGDIFTACARKCDCNAQPFSIFIFLLIAIGLAFLIPGIIMRVEAAVTPSPLLDIHLCPIHLHANSPRAIREAAESPNGALATGMPSATSSATAAATVAASRTGNSGAGAGTGDFNGGVTSDPTSSFILYKSSGQTCEMAGLSQSGSGSEIKIPIHNHMFETGVTYVPFLLFPANVVGHVTMELRRTVTKEQQQQQQLQQQQQQRGAVGAAASPSLPSLVESGSSTTTSFSSSSSSSSPSSSSSSSASTVTVFKVTQSLAPTISPAITQKERERLVYVEGAAEENTQLRVFSSRHAGSSTDCSHPRDGCYVTVPTSLNQVVMKQSTFSLPKSERYRSGPGEWEVELAQGLTLTVNSASVTYVHKSSPLALAVAAGGSSSGGAAGRNADAGAGAGAGAVAGAVSDDETDAPAIPPPPVNEFGAEEKPSIYIGFLQYSLSPLQSRGVAFIIRGIVIIVLGLGLAFYSVNIDPVKNKIT